MSDEEYYDDEETYEDDEIEEDEVEQEPRPFSASDYTTEMAATLGVALTSELIEQCLRAGDARSINKILMTAPKPVAVVNPSTGVSDSAKQLFRELLSHRNTARAQELERAINEYVNRATAYMNDAKNRLVEASNRRTELEQYLRSETKDMSEEVLKVVADGWYTFDEAKTVDWNNSQSNKSLWFITAPITLSYYKPSIGIDIKVPMGSFYVQYSPQQSRLSVWEHQDNVRTRRDYYHPHVSSGDVCWGNGADRVNRALIKYDLFEAMGVLRTLLQTYNEESPYDQIQSFNEIVNPLSRAPRPAHFQLYGTRTVWMYDRYIPNVVNLDGVVDKLNSGYFYNNEHCAYPATRFKVYRMLFIDTGDRVPDTPYYLKDKQGRFHPISEARIKYWPNSDEPVRTQTVVVTPLSSTAIPF